MKLWVCSFTSAKHPHLGYFTEHKATFRVSCDQTSSGEVKHSAAVSVFKIESAREAAGSQASPAVKKAKRPLLSMCYHLIIVSFVLILVGLVLPTFPETTSLNSKNFLLFRTNRFGHSLS